MVDSWEDDSRYQNVDDAIQEWRQGDCVLGEQWFIHRFDRELPLTEESSAVAGEDVDITEMRRRDGFGPPSRRF
jgi:hypothetical protein